MRRKLRRSCRGPAVPDMDRAWERLRASLAEGDRQREIVHVRMPRARTWQLATGSYRLRVGFIALSVAVAGVVAATVFTGGAPANKLPPSLSASGTFGQIATLVGVDHPGVVGGFPTPSGTLSLPFGTVSWTSSGPSRTVSSLAEAEAATGLKMVLPGVLPDGVGQPHDFVVQPAVTANFSFGAGAGSALKGTALTITLGPATLVEYGNSTTSGSLPTLLIGFMSRPSTSSTKASSDQLEAFVLSKPGLPSRFIEEIRLLNELGNLAGLHLRPVSGVSVSVVTVNGSPGVLAADDGGVAAGVVWQDRGAVHAALGLLDTKDILDVANQLG